jgi:hypothetical protein
MAWINIAVLLSNDIVHSPFILLIIYLYQLIPHPHSSKKEAYRQFIRLKIELGDSLGKLMVPSCDVDGMWRVHVIDIIRAYMSYCKMHCGGYLLKSEDPLHQTDTI